MKGTRVVRLREYDQDPNALFAHDVLPAAFAPVRKGPARSFWSVGSMTAIGSCLEDASRSANPPPRR